VFRKELNIRFTSLLLKTPSQDSLLNLKIKSRIVCLSIFLISFDLTDCFWTGIFIVNIWASWSDKSFQNGITEKSSTELATFPLINNILTAMNNNLKIGGIFCDLQKAFDCGNHEILLNKLEFYGIQGQFKTLIESFNWQISEIKA